MFNSSLNKTAVNQAVFMVVSLWIYVSIGVSRSYVALLFYQLELPGARFHLTDYDKTWIATSVGLLSPFISLSSGYLMDVLGRKRCVQLLFGPLLLTWIMVTISMNYTLLLIAMLTQSIGMGMAICTVTYMSEITSAENRGILFALVDLSFNSGGIMCDVLMYFLKWYTVSTIFGILTCISLVLTSTLPESPQWLYLKGKKVKAIDTLCSIRGKSVNELEDEIKNLEKMFSENSQKTGFLQTMKSCLNGWKQFSIATLFLLLAVLAGPMFILSYIVLILNSLKLPYNSALITVIYSISCFVGSIINPYMVHKCRRKTLMGVSSFGMVLSMLLIGIYEEVYYFNDEKPIPWIIPGALCFYGILCSIGVLPIMFVIGGELFPPECKGTLQGIFGFVITIIWAISLKYYPLILFDLGIRTLIWTFVISCTLLTLFAIFILPETKNKSLTEIQEQYFSKKKKNVTSSQA